MARTGTDIKQLGKLLFSCDCPVYVLDDRRRVVYCNPACLEWLGVDQDELLGRQCNYHSQLPESDDIAAAICPPPEAFNGVRVEGRVVVGTAAGVGRRVAFVPLGEDADCVGVIGLAAAADDRESDAGPLVGDTTAASLHQRLQQLALAARGTYRVDPWAGEGTAMRKVRAQARIAMESAATLTIVGPAGAGKEYLARAIEQAARTDQSPTLLPLDASLLDAELLQATIVDYLRRWGEPVASSLPTLLILDADQLSASAQHELLGLYRLPTVQLRTLATARQSLVELAAEGRFDAELAARLSVLEIRLPPLADRREDIPLLVQRVIEQMNSRGEKQLGGCSDEVLDLLGALPWEGNLDELTEVVRVAWQSAEGAWIEDADLPPRVRLLKAAAEHPLPAEENIQLDRFLEEIEREVIARALQRAKGNKSQAARMLGVQRARLLRRISSLGLSEE